MAEVEMKKKDVTSVKDGLIDFTAGSLGGFALVYAGQPLDTVKVKMQTFPTLYNNMFDCFMKTLRSDGIAKGLYAGTVPALVTNITENAVLFFCYGFCQKLIQKFNNHADVNDLSVIDNATAGFFASFFSSLAICPTELIKCKLQAMSEVGKQAGNHCHQMGSFKLTCSILKEEGIRGMFRGLTPTLVREMPGYFFFFGGYEGTRELLRNPDEKKDDIGLLKTMVAGSVGGITFWTFTYPIDVVKSRIQVNNIQDNMVALSYKIFRNEGVTALYNGLVPTLIRTIPATATLFVTYEYSKKGLHYLFQDF